MPILNEAGSALSYKVLDICSDAAIEVNILAPGDTLDGETAQWIFRKINYLIDLWQAQEFFVYGYQYPVFSLVPGLSPHTIGPAGVPVPTFSTDPQPRPVRLESASLLLNTSGELVDQPMNIRDHAWWAAQQTKQIQTNIPTDVYYDPTSPLGSLYFWPVPNQANQVRLQLWQTVSSFQEITDPIGGPGGPGTLPQAYRSALMYTLAESLLPGAAREAHPVLIAAALAARKAVFGNNAKSPRMATQDYGMPRAGRKAGTRGDFNWATGGAPGGRAE
jgi:hypothetical protein